MAERYFIKLIVNGIEASPTPPIVGFDSKLSLLEWVKLNWYFLGKWYLTKNRLVVFLKGENPAKGFLDLDVRTGQLDFTEDFSGDFF